MVKYVQITATLAISNERGIDNLRDPRLWNITLIDEKNGELIFDVDLTLEGEKCWEPKIIMWE